MPKAEEAKSAATVFEGVTPILTVANMQTSIDHYVGVLGFKLNWGW